MFGRHPQVSYHQTFSSPEPIFCGVPQGSILGPLLFLLHFNESATVLSKFKIVKYADDTVLFYSGKDIGDIEKELSNEFNAFTTWLENNELILNCKKGKTAEVMVFGTSSRLSKLNIPPIQIKHRFSNISYTSSYKYLGLSLNSTLDMSEHVRKSLSKAASRVNLLRKMRSFLDSKTAAKIYNAMILHIVRLPPLVQYHQALKAKSLLWKIEQK